jgi:ABC-2 type transport system ATP-binding protein
MALEGFGGLELTDDAVSLPAPDGVATLGEMFSRVGSLGIELADISLRKPSLEAAG